MEASKHVYHEARQSSQLFRPDRFVKEVQLINECLGVSNVFPTVQAVVTYHHEVASIPLSEVNQESCSVSA